MRGINFQQLAQAIWDYAGTRSLSDGALQNQADQAGSITFGSGGTSATATITSVDVNKTELVMLGFSIANGVGGQATPANYPKLALTNATTVTATRESGLNTGANGVTGTVHFRVREIP